MNRNIKVAKLGKYVTENGCRLWNTEKEIVECSFWYVKRSTLPVMVNDTPPINTDKITENIETVKGDQ